MQLHVQVHSRDFLIWSRPTHRQATTFKTLLYLLNPETDQVLQLKRGRCTKLNIFYPLIARQRSAREDFVPTEIKSGGKGEVQLQIQMTGMKL